MNTGKCPKCGVVPNRVDVEQLAASASMFSGEVWRAVAYVCPAPECRAILGVQIDPLAIRSDLNNHAKTVKDELEKKLLPEIKGVQNQLRALLHKKE